MGARLESDWTLGDVLFTGLAEELGLMREARAAILPVPYDLTTSYRPGARRGLNHFRNEDSSPEAQK